MHAIAPYPTYALLLLNTFFLTNVGIALAPIYRTPDTCEDIPLDPSQRKLLGLPPMSRPATPQEKEQYLTPPRYSRSATPRSSSSSLHAEISGSPLSGRGTPYENNGYRISPSGSFYGSTQQRRSSASPLTPAGLRPGAERRRLSYNNSSRSSPLSISEFDAAGSINTPTKTPNRASVGLNSKWLFEKGRAVPVSAWGTGSVFS